MAFCLWDHQETQGTWNVAVLEDNSGMRLGPDGSSQELAGAGSS